MKAILREKIKTHEIFKSHDMMAITIGNKN